MICACVGCTGYWVLSPRLLPLPPPRPLVLVLFMSLRRAPRDPAVATPFTARPFSGAWIRVCRRACRGARRWGSIVVLWVPWGGANFVGSWRVIREEARVPAWEGEFCLGRRVDF
ncbi:hypothetical protein Hypma_004902, partial [Hypsizygus marmoreus]